MSLVDAAQPWAMLALGVSLAVNGVHMIWMPQKYVCVGFIPASDSRTVKVFGIFSLTIGLLGIGLHSVQLF